MAERRFLGAAVIIYVGNDELQTEDVKDAIAELREQQCKVITRNPNFYGGEIEAVGGQIPNLVIVQNHPRFDVIAEKYREARSESGKSFNITVERIDVKVPTPEGTVEAATQLPAERKPADSGAGAGAKDNKKTK